jgi:hypothetical protein
MAKGKPFPFAAKGGKSSKPNPFAKKGGGMPAAAPEPMPFKRGGKVGRK